MKKTNSKIIVTNNPKIVKAEKLLFQVLGLSKKEFIIQKKEVILPLKEFLLSEKPILGICLGMQYLMEDSYEFNKNKTPGFSYFKGSVIKFNEKE